MRVLGVIMYSLIRKLLFLLDAEDAHELATAQMMRLQQIRWCCTPSNASAPLPHLRA